MNVAPAVAAEPTLEERYVAARARSLRLAAPLSAEDCAAQSMPQASPVAWHLAHVTRFVEAGVLEATVPGYRPYDPAYARLFDGCHSEEGRRLAPADRAAQARRPFDEIVDYRRHVDARLSALMTAGAPAQALPIARALRHELWHQERLLADLKHWLATRAGAPPYAAALPPAGKPLLPFDWHALPGGGAIAGRPVACGEYAKFIAGGGYARREWWLPEGWAACVAAGWQAPLYWRRAGAGWAVFTLHGEQPLDPSAPLCHVGFYEADAYARWAGARLPTEAEWTSHAATQQFAGQFAEDGVYQPQARDVVAQVFGGVREWTASVASPAEGGDNSVANQHVLCGASCVTPRALAREGARLLLPPTARWQFSGIRLVRDSV